MGRSKNNTAKPINDPEKDENPALAGWSRWHLIVDKNYKTNKVLYRVKRTRRFNGKLQAESIPAAKLKLYTNKAQLEKYVEQLNKRYVSAKERAEEAYQFRHLFITEPLIEKFAEVYKAGVNDKSFADWMVKILRKNCLNWFITQFGENDPVEWKRNEHIWGHALLCNLEENGVTGKKAEKYRLFEEPIHPDSVNKHVQIANRFMSWLHVYNPEIFPPIHFAPISRAVMKKYKADYGATDGDDYIPGKYIEEEDWKIIKKEIDSRIKPFVLLQYGLGLRRTEAMAIDPEAIEFEDKIPVTRQLLGVPDGKPEFGPTKSRAKREVDTWFMSAEEVHEQASSIQFMHPSTYSHIFYEEMARLGKAHGRDFDYSTHDMRRTWITRALEAGKPSIKVMQAAGHRHLKTTEKYIRKSVADGRKKFVPKVVKK